MTEYKLAQQWNRNAVREIEGAEDREKQLKAECDVARSRYHFARRRWLLTVQWKRDMEELAKQCEEDMQELALWERATQGTCPETHWIWGARDRAWRHTSMCGSTSEETVDTLDLPEPWIDAASRAGAAKEDEREGETHEETPALPTLLPMPADADKGKDENEAKEDDAMTRESVSAMPASTPVAANRWQRQQWQRESNVDVQKRRRTNEGGGFKIDGRERSTTDAYIQTKRDDSYNGECATVGCSRERHAIGNDATRLGWQGVFPHKQQKP